MNLNISGISSHFRNFANKIHHNSCIELDDVYREMSNNLNEMKEYWKGLTADSYYNTLSEKITRIFNMIDDLEHLGSSIASNAIKYEDRKENELEQLKNDALKNGDHLTYARLCIKDFFDGEYSEE